MRLTVGQASVLPFLAILAAEIAAELFAESEVVRAAAVGAVLMLVATAIVAYAATAGAFRIRRSLAEQLLVLAPLALAGLYGAALGVYRGNSVYYVAADVYHTFFELLLVTVIAAVFFQRLTPVQLVRTLSWTFLLLGGMGVMGTLLGMAGLISTGGHEVEALGLWRLNAGRGFPEVPLILLLASYRYRGPLPAAVRLVRAAAVFVLVLSFAAVLKRSMWLTFLAVSPVLFLHKRLIGIGVAAALGILPLLVLGYLLAPGLFLAAGAAAAQLLTYNPNYTVEDTLVERVQQIANVWPYMKATVLGYGSGAEFYTYWPGENRYGYVHYVHNLYVYYFLQLGYAGLVLYFAPFAALGWRLWRRVGEPDHLEWVRRGALAATVALLANGLTMVSLHTTFAGVMLALGVVSLTVPRAVSLPRRLYQPVPPRAVPA